MRTRETSCNLCDVAVRNPVASNLVRVHCAVRAQLLSIESAHIDEEEADTVDDVAAVTQSPTTATEVAP